MSAYEFQIRSKLPIFSAIVYRNPISWLSEKNEGWSKDNVGLDVLTITNIKTGNSISIRIQSVANHPDAPDGNSVVGDFQLLYKSKSASFVGFVLVITNSETESGIQIGADGRSSGGGARWLVHAPWRAGESKDDSAPFSAGCFIPVSSEEMKKLMDFLKKEGIAEGTRINGTVVEQEVNR